MVKVLVIGSGGREHALGWKLAQSKHVDEVLYAPGNAGTANEDKGRNIDIDGAKKENFPAIAKLIKKEQVELTIIGPENPLDDGIVDYLEEQGCLVFGPLARATKLESDKFYSYKVMEAAGILQAESVCCTSKEEAIEAIKELCTEKGIVLKAKGLAAGKGVVICDSQRDALEEIEHHHDKFGPEVVVAERLYGEEFSVFGLSDGENIAVIEMSFQDHKRLRDDDKGPNTGGMGAYGPAPVAPAEIVRKVAKEVMEPTIRQMKKQGDEYKGFVYAGLIMTEEGMKVIEFNARFGDPEAQPAMMMLKSDLYEAIMMALQGELDEIDLEFKPGASCCVVMASQGYPGNYEKGLELTGLDFNIPDVKVFHAGTKEKNGKVLTNGGRVLGVTGYSDKGIKEAIQAAYSGVEKIEGLFYRKDIGKRALQR
ncbi:phosphoribosylamine--glycine ligase [Nanoarchaeota archaeon]